MTTSSNKIKIIIKQTGKVFLVLGCVFIAVVVWINYEVRAESNDYIYHDINKIKNSQVILVLGAAVKPNKEMSDVFRDRVDTAIELYNRKKALKIIISGDHGKKYYDEVTAAKKYILEKGISPDDVFLDHAGFDTYDSIYRAKYIFEAESIIVVTQDFHLPRAIFIGRKLGNNIQGFSADLHNYSNIASMKNREIFANIKAYLDIVLNEKPQFLGQKIDLNSSGINTWD